MTRVPAREPCSVAAVGPASHIPPVAPIVLFALLLASPSGVIPPAHAEIDAQGYDFVPVTMTPGTLTLEAEPEKLYVHRQ